MKNPLSPLIYHLRHKRSTLLLVAIVCLATVGIYVMVSVLDSIPMRARSSYLTQVSRVYPSAGDALEPGVVAQIETHPDVARVVLDNGPHINAPTLIGLDSVRLAGVSQEDAQYLIAHIGLRLKEGRMFAPRTNEIVLSEVTARVLGLRLGDAIDRSVSQDYYGAIPAPLVLVGILEQVPLAAPSTGSGPWPKTDPTVETGRNLKIGFLSYEYLASHEQFAPRPVGLLVVAQAGRQAAVEGFLETTITSARTETETFREVSQLVAMARRGLYLIFGVVSCVVALIVALVIGVINRIDSLFHCSLIHYSGVSAQADRRPPDAGDGPRDVRGLDRGCGVRPGGAVWTQLHAVLRPGDGTRPGEPGTVLVCPARAGRGDRTDGLERLADVRPLRSGRHH